LITRFISFLRTLYKNRYMIKSFALADLKRQYEGSYGGMFWAFGQPLLLILTYYIIFGFIFSKGNFLEYGTKSFALFLLGGMVPWLYFSAVVSRSSTVLLENKSLVTKTLFPSEIIPICLMVTGIINHLIGLAILIVFTIAITGTLSPFAIFVLPYFLLMSLMVLGVSWILSSLNVFVRDIGQLVAVVLNIWFFYTPIFYPLSVVPEKYKIFLKINPLYVVADGYRRTLIQGTYPDPYKLMYLAAVSIAMFIIGGMLYKKLKPAFIDVL